MDARIRNPIQRIKSLDVARKRAMQKVEEIEAEIVELKSCLIESNVLHAEDLDEVEAALTLFRQGWEGVLHVKDSCDREKLVEIARENNLQIVFDDGVLPWCIIQ